MAFWSKFTRIGLVTGCIAFSGQTADGETNDKMKKSYLYSTGRECNYACDTTIFGPQKFITYKKCIGDVTRYVVQNSPQTTGLFKMDIGLDFLNSTDRDRAGTIIHELSHLALGGGYDEYDIFGIAERAPAIAVKNAPTYEAFSIIGINGL